MDKECHLLEFRWAIYEWIMYLLFEKIDTSNSDVLLIKHLKFFPGREWCPWIDSIMIAYANPALIGSCLIGLEFRTPKFSFSPYFARFCLIISDRKSMKDGLSSVFSRTDQIRCKRWLCGLFDTELKVIYFVNDKSSSKQIDKPFFAIVL